MKKGVSDDNVGTTTDWPFGGETRFLTLKSTRRELNSFAVSWTSLLWISVETNRKSNFKLDFTKCIMI